MLPIVRSEGRKHDILERAEYDLSQKLFFICELFVHSLSPAQSALSRLCSTLIDNILFLKFNSIRVRGKRKSSL